MPRCSSTRLTPGQAVLHRDCVAFGQAVGHGLALDQVLVLLQRQRWDARQDERADDADQADEQVVHAEIVHEVDLREHDDGERDGHGRERRRHDGRLARGVVAALVLVGREHDAERAVADPRRDAVDRRAAGDLEQRAHDLGEQRADELEQAEVEQQRQQQACQQEDDDEHGEQVAQHEPAGVSARRCSQASDALALGVQPMPKKAIQMKTAPMTRMIAQTGVAVNVLSTMG